MIEELVNNRDTFIIVACIVITLYCALDIAFKFGQAFSQKSAIKQINNQLNNRQQQAPPTKEKEDEDYLKRMMTLSPAVVIKPESSSNNGKKPVTIKPKQIKRKDNENSF